MYNDLTAFIRKSKGLPEDEVPQERPQRYRNTPVSVLLHSPNYSTETCRHIATAVVYSHITTHLLDPRTSAIIAEHLQKLYKNNTFYLKEQFSPYASYIILTDYFIHARICISPLSPINCYTCPLYNPTQKENTCLYQLVKSEIHLKAMSEFNQIGDQTLKETIRLIEAQEPGTTIKQDQKEKITEAIKKQTRISDYSPLENPVPTAEYLDRTSLPCKGLQCAECIYYNPKKPTCVQLTIRSTGNSIWFQHKNKYSPTPPS